MFFPDGGGSYWVVFGEEAVAGKGITVLANGHPVSVGYEDIGEQIHAAVFAIATGGVTPGWVETNGECPCTDEK